MAFDITKGVPIESPLRKKKRGALGKTAEFLAPTATKAFESARAGEGVTARQAVGGALEIGSFLLPVGAVASGFALAGKGARALAGVAKAKPKTQLEGLQAGLKGLFKKTKGQAKTGAQIGSVAGAGFGAGRALGEEDLGAVDVAKEALLTGAIGGVGGALITPITSLVGATAKKLAGVTAGAFRSTKRVLKPTDRASAVDDLTKALNESFVEDKAAVIKALEKIGKRDNVDEETLLRNLVDSGYIPKIEGTIGRWKGALSDMNDRIGALARGQEKLLKPNIQQTKLNQLKKDSLAVLRGRTDIDKTKTIRQINRLFDDLKIDFGDTLSAIDVSKVLTRMNKGSSKAFLKEAFVEDASTAIGKAARRRLDVLDPESTIFRQEMGKLFTLKRTAGVLDNRVIDVGFLGQAMGRFLGVVGAGSVGLKVAGSGGLVVAGIMANLGSKSLANLIRQARFNPQAQALIRQGMRSDQKLLNKLINEADPIDKAFLKRAFRFKEIPARTEAIPLGAAELGTPSFRNP